MFVVSHALSMSAMISLETLPHSFQNEIEKASNPIIIRSNVKNLEDCNKWVKEFGVNTNTKWNSRDSNPRGKKYVCSKVFVCHHSAFMKIPKEANKRCKSKNSSCQAQIKIKVELDTPITRAIDAFILRGLVAVITIQDVHNHSLYTAEALKFLPTTDSKEKFLDYFNDGMGPVESCKYHESVLQLKEEFKEEDMANSRINPPYRAVRYWYDQWRLQNLGPRTSQGVIEKLKEKSKIYEDNGIVLRFSEEPFAVVILTPLMKRAHNLKSSSKIVFVDSTSSCDPDNHSITFMLRPCSAGAVPIAVIITKGQTEDAYKKGFQLLNGALEKTFFGDGHPLTFMTDDSEAEIKALKSVWPSSRNLLCILNVAQAVWSWLWDSRHNIANEHRSMLMLFFQRILYARTIEEAEEAYKNSKGYIGAYLPTYANWNEYLQKYWERKELWCLAFRNENVRGHNTNNFSEVCVRIFKDEVLCRVKAYNVVTILDFISTHLEAHYVKRFRDFANNGCTNIRLFLLSLKKKASTITKDDIEMHSIETFSVKRDANCYAVNMKTGCCSCSKGLYGRFCEHQYSILMYYDVTSCNFPPVLPEDEHEISVLALGEKDLVDEMVNTESNSCHEVEKVGIPLSVLALGEKDLVDEMANTESNSCHEVAKVGIPLSVLALGEKDLVDEMANTESNSCHEVAKVGIPLSELSGSNEDSSKYTVSDKLFLKDRDKSFQCEVCMEVFKCKNLLSEHVCSKARLKPFNSEIAIIRRKLQYQNWEKKKICTTSSRKKSSYFKRNSFLCCKCQEVFENKSSLALHFCTFQKNTVMKTYNRASTALKSDTSKRSDEQNLPVNDDQSLDIPQFICAFCKQHFHNEESLMFHLRCHIEAKYVCEDCQTIFDTKILLASHRSSIKRKKFLCNVCEKVFCCEQNLINHCEIHSRNNEFHCDLCDRLFKNKFILNVHYFSHTKNLPSFICPVCLEIFNNRSNWIHHRCIHMGIKPYICEICRKYFIKWRHFYLHCRIHTDEVPYNCETCHKNFKYRNTLIMHERNHVRGNT